MNEKMKYVLILDRLKFVDSIWPSPELDYVELDSEARKKFDELIDLLRKILGNEM